MAEQIMYARIHFVNDILKPAVIRTSGGSFQIKRGLTKQAYGQLLGALRRNEGTGVECRLSYIPQGPQSGSRHTLTGVSGPF